MDTSAARLKTAVRAIVQARCKGLGKEWPAAISADFKMRSHYLL